MKLKRLGRSSFPVAELNLVEPVAAAITEADVDDWASRLWAAVETWSPDPLKIQTAITFDRVRETVIGAIRSKRRRDPLPSDAVLGEAMDSTLNELATRVQTRRGGRDACLKYFLEMFNTAIGKAEAAAIERRTNLVKAHVEIGHVQNVSKARLARYNEKAGAGPSGAKPKAVADPIEEALGRGANAVIVQKFCRPMLVRFASMPMRERADWVVATAEMLTEVLVGKSSEETEQVLAWAAKSLRDECEDKFVPPPKTIRDGFESYFKRKAELGTEFTENVVFPKWDPQHLRKASRWGAEQYVREQNEKMAAQNRAAEMANKRDVIH